MRFLDSPLLMLPPVLLWHIVKVLAFKLRTQ